MLARKPVIGNMFLSGETKESAIEQTKKIMDETLREHGYKKLDIKVEAWPSSKEEAAIYRTKMALNPFNDVMVN